MRPRDSIDLDTLRTQIASGGPVVVGDIDIAVSTIHGRKMIFAGDRVQDPIQRANRRGQFYEEPELAVI